MTDKQFCMSSYLAFRYIERDDMDFFEGIYHRPIVRIKADEKVPEKDEKDTDRGEWRRRMKQCK